MPTLEIQPTQEKWMTHTTTTLGGGGGSWANTRNAVTATTISNAPTAGAKNNVYSAKIAAFGNSFFYIYRTYSDFDLSSLPAGAIITAATINLFGEAVSGVDQSDIIIVKGTYDSSLAVEDFDSIDNWSSGTATPTAYSSVLAAGSYDTSDYNSISLNSTAITDLQSAYEGGTRFKTVYMNHTHDHENSLPSSGQLVGLDYIGMQGDASQRPYLELTYLKSSGFLHLKNGTIKITDGTFKF